MGNHIAIVTVSGKAYFKLVREIKKRKVRFFSFVPGDRIFPEIKVVITTEKEKHRIEHNRIITFNPEDDPKDVIDEALLIVEEREKCEEVTIGVDPGKTFGFAALCDGKVIESKSGLAIERVLDLIATTLDTIPSNKQKIKIGLGVPSITNKLIERLGQILPKTLVETVSENGTSYIFSNGSRKKLSDGGSAIEIARKEGNPLLSGE
jgi:hypothetical protein